MSENTHTAAETAENVYASTDLNEVMLQPVEPGLLERRVVLDVWDRLQLLLMSGLGAMQHTLRIMSGSLPAVEELAEDQLPELAQLHMSSAGNLRHTMHQLAPDSSAGHSCTTPDRGMLNELNEAQSGAVAVLIELQLFHLHRASALLAHHRAMRVLQEERQSSTPA